MSIITNKDTRKQITLNNTLKGDISFSSPIGKEKTIDDHLDEVSAKIRTHPSHNY